MEDLEMQLLKFLHQHLMEHYQMIKYLSFDKTNRANFFGFIKSALSAARKAVDDLTKAANRLKTPFKDLPKEIEKSDDSFAKVYKGIENYFKRAEETRQRAIQEIDEINKLIEEGAEGAKKQKDTFVGIELSLKKISEEFLEQANKQFKSINETIAKGVLTGIKSISKGIAESIVLGKKLSDVFKNIAQRILVNVIAKLIEERLIKIANLILVDELLRTKI
jgi:methyl-accepting chemotaxis protein